MKNRPIHTTILKFAALGLVGTAAGVVGVAEAQPYLINLSGATLLENFIKAPAATNDFIDCDGDGIAGSKNGVNEQLNPSGLPPTGHWAVQYRAVGSVNGLQELIDFSDVFVTENDPEGLLKASVCSKAFCNRTQYINNGGQTNPIFNSGNPGALPLRSTLNGTYLANYSAPPIPTAGGVQIDLAPVDVPARWAVFLTGGTPAFAALPGTLGYGNNERLAVNKDGSPTTFNNKLANIKDKNLFNPANPGAADSKTLFDTPIALAPIACVTNLGTGYQQLDMSNVRHLFTTGRLMNGENIVAVTRDSGSGTRNGFNNTTCTDPSWGVGDNVGALSNPADEHKLGPDFLPSNKAGNGQVESTTQSHRLAIGYAGAERGVNSTWLTGGRLEIIAIRNDLSGGTGYHRPEIDKVLDNGAEGYNVGGPAVFVSLGDPKAEPVAKGGLNNGLPKMKNAEAACYLNNTTKSVEAFVAVPGGDPTLFSPGELLATQLILTAATDKIHDPTNPCNMIANPVLNQPLQDYTRANNVLKNPAYKSFGTVTLDGFAPDRKSGLLFSDNNAGNHFILQDGTTVAYLSSLCAVSARNRIAGDFDGNGARNLSDAAEMMKAWKSRNGGPAWVAPNGTGPILGASGAKASIEILGDFNGDGNFGRKWNGSAFVADKEDLRYWADGLALVGGKLDRKAGFTAIDDQFGGNFFGTVWGDGRPYTNGDSRFDVAGPGKFTARGWAPTGADGVIDQNDINYVAAQFQGINPSGVDWANTSQAVLADLSADMTGDLLINQADLDAFGSATVCYPDCDGDNALSIDDFICFQTFFALGDIYADCDGDTFLSIDDFICFQTFFAIGC